MNNKLIKMLTFTASIFALNANAAIITGNNTTVDANGNITTITDSSSSISSNINNNIANTAVEETTEDSTKSLASEQENSNNSQNSDDAEDYTASENSNIALITSAQLKSYDEAVKYLDCVYSGNAGCSGFDSTNQARSEVLKYKDLDSTGLNAGKKKALDNVAKGLLPVLTVDEVKTYLNSTKNLSALQLADEMTDNVTITTTMTMPGENSLALAEKGTYSAKGMNKDSETSTSVMNKEEYISTVKESVTEDSNQPYTATPAYLKGVDYTKDKGSEVEYFTNTDSTQVTSKTTSKMVAAGMGMLTTSVYSQVYIRSAQDGYDIKMLAQDVNITREITSNAAKAEDVPVINVKADFDITKANEIDEGWVNRYDDIKAKNAIDRKYSANYLMLEYAVDAASKLYDKAKTETDATKAQEYKDQADKALTDSKQFYDNLSDFTNDEKVVKLRNRYLSVKGY